MKRKTTKQILAESLQELAQKKNIEKITVKEIVDNCQLSTTTFYRLFKDKYDLILWDYLESANEIMDKVGKNNYPWSQTLYDGLHYFWDNREYMKNLLLHTNGYDAFIRHQTAANIGILESYITKTTGIKELDDDTKIYVRMFVFATVQTIAAWLTGSIECTPTHLGQLFENTVPDPLRTYLY